MNECYEKYMKGKKTTLLVKLETKERLNELQFDIRLKSIDDVLNHLIESYKNKK